MRARKVNEGLKPLPLKSPFKVREMDPGGDCLEFYLDDNRSYGDSKAWYGWCNQNSYNYKGKVVSLMPQSKGAIDEILGEADTLEEAEEIILNHYKQIKFKRKTSWS